MIKFIKVEYQEIRVFITIIKNKTLDIKVKQTDITFIN